MLARAHRLASAVLLTSALGIGGLAGCAEDYTLPQPPVVREVRSITVEPSSQELFVGQRFTFNARVVADSGVATGVTWTTSNASVATVNATTGEVTAVAPGSALITATSTATTGPTRSASASVLVAGRCIGGCGPSISVTPAAFTLTVGATSTLGVTFNAPASLPRTVTCASSAPRVVATATAADATTCTVTGVAPGSATITVASTADPTVTAVVGITATPNPVSIVGISVDPSNARLAAGDSLRVAVTIVRVGGAIAPTFTATSSNQNAVRAAVTTTGTGAGATSTLTLTGVAPGTATVNVCSTVETNVCAQVGVTVMPR